MLAVDGIEVRAVRGEDGIGDVDGGVAAPSGPTVAGANVGRSEDYKTLAGTGNEAGALLVAALPFSSMAAP